MKLAALVGGLCGLTCALAKLAVGALLSRPSALKLLNDIGWTLPLLIGAAILIVGTLSMTGLSARGWEDLFESYYLGTVVNRKRVWLFRACITALGAAVLSVFGLIGAIVEAGLAGFAKITQRWRLYYEERQIFVASLFSGALAAVFESPFFGALFAIEIFVSNNARVRASIVVAALTGFAASVLFQGRLLSADYQGSVFHSDLFSVLLASQHRVETGGAELFKLMFCCALLGVAACLLAFFAARGVLWASRVFDRFFSSGNVLRVGLTGLLLSILFVTTFGGDFDWSIASGAHLFEDLAWARLSAPSAAVLLALKISLFLIAAAGWGSLGLFVPVLTIGAVLGYFVSCLAFPSWIVPLVAGGAAAAAGAFFGAPLALSALLLETTHDMRLWWLGSVAVFSAYATGRLLRFHGFPALILREMDLEVYEGRVVSLLRGIKVSDLMTREVQTLSKQASVQELRAAVAQSPYNVLAVTGSDGKYAGILSVEYIPTSVRGALQPDLGSGSLKTMEALDSILEINDLIDAEAPVIDPGSGVIEALRKFSNHPFVAVVDEGGYLCGVLFESTVHARYRRELANAGMRLQS